MHLTLRQKIANFLKKRHGTMSLRAFALIAKTDDAVLDRMEHCLQTVNVEQIENFARAFKCSILEVMGLGPYDPNIQNRLTE